jgi:glycerol uptake facilitator-like aquaporin
MRKCAEVFGHAFTLASAVLIALASASNAQQRPPPQPLPNPSIGGNLFSVRTQYEFWLTCLIAFVGLTVIATIIWSVSRNAHARPEDTTRPVIVVTVIMGTLILVTAGYSNEQIAPAFGLFGTIIGYILGRLGSARTETSGEAGHSRQWVAPANSAHPAANDGKSLANVPEEIPR